MTAFIPTTPSSSFSPRQNVLANSANKSPKRHVTPMATANFPEDAAAPYTKYLQFIPPGRLNKAPIITLNSYPDEFYNNISIRWTDAVADQSAAATLTAGLDISDEKPQPESVWGKYYDPETVNMAPYISLSGSADQSADTQYVFLVNTVVPTNVNDGKAILDGAPPDPAIYVLPFWGRLNEAPFVSVSGPEESDKPSVSDEMVPVGLNTYAAEQILATYRS